WPSIATSKPSALDRMPTPSSHRPNSAAAGCSAGFCATERPMRVLVTGGAGYVGSISAEWLIGLGHVVTILDSMVKGHRDAVPPRAGLVVGEIGDRALLDRIFGEHEIEAVLHCGGRALVGESVANPAMYFDENV